MKNYEEYLFCQSLDIDLHLTKERLDHIIKRHPEFKNLNREFRDTVYRPNFILKKTTGELLLISWHPQLFNGKFMVVVIRMDSIRSWIITAFLSRKRPIGELYEN